MVIAILVAAVMISTAIVFAPLIQIAVAAAVVRAGVQAQQEAQSQALAARQADALAEAREQAARSEAQERYYQQVPYGSDGQAYGGPGVAAPSPWRAPRYLPLPPAMVPRAPHLEGAPEPVRTWPRHLWSPMN